MSIRTSTLLVCYSLHRTPTGVKSRIYTMKRHSRLRKQSHVHREAISHHFSASTILFPDCIVHFYSYTRYILQYLWRTLPLYHPIFVFRLSGRICITILVVSRHNDSDIRTQPHYRLNLQHVSRSTEDATLDLQGRARESRFCRRARSFKSVLTGCSPRTSVPDMEE